MKQSILALITACVIGLYAAPLQAEPALFGFELRARPVAGYAKFENSNFQGDMGDYTGTRSKNEDTFVGGVAVSLVRSWGPWRSELEYTWRGRTDVNGYIEYADRTATVRNNLQNQSVTVNTYRSFGRSPRFTPYVMGGVGLVRHWSDSEYFFSDDSRPEEGLDNFETQLTFHAGVGVEWRLNSGWTVDAGYRYADLGEASTGPFSDGVKLSTGRLNSHDLILNLRKRY